MKLQLHRVLFVRCSGSVDFLMFSLIEKELKTLLRDAGFEVLDLTGSYYEGKYYSIRSFFGNILGDRKVYYARELIRQKKPSIVVSGNDGGISGHIIKACRLLDIPTLVIQHGVLTERRTRGIIDFLRLRRYLLWRLVSAVSSFPLASELTLRLGWRTRVLDWGLGNATAYAVFGDYYKRVLMSRGVPSHKIAVTGYFMTDLVRKRISAFRRSKTLRELGISEDKPVVLYTSQSFVEDGVWNHNQRDLLTKALIYSATRLSHLQFIIKIHPREDIDYYRRIVRSSKSRIVIIRDFDLNDLIQLSEMVITISSTTGLWSLIYNKPLIVIDCQHLSVPDQNVNIEFGIVVSNLENMPNVIENVLRDPHMNSKLNRVKEDQLYKPDGLASRRIAKLIFYLLSRGSATHN